jgi:hypothetical protein
MNSPQKQHDEESHGDPPVITSDVNEESKLRHQNATVEHLTRIHRQRTLETHKPEDDEYTVWLNFKNAVYEEEYIETCKRDILKPSAFIGLTIISLCYYFRMPLSPALFVGHDYSAGRIASLVTVVLLLVGTIPLSCVYMSHILLGICGIKKGRLFKFCYWVLCESGMENLTCLACAVNASAGVVSRVLRGPC